MKFTFRPAVVLALFCSLLLAARAALLDPGSLVSSDVGNPAGAGAMVVTDGKVELTAGGAGIGPRTDQFHFAAISLTNDFDLKVRVASLANTETLARAGLLVRESLEANAPFAGVFVSPSVAGTHFLSRTSANAVANQSGLFPPNLPYAWLRLQRTGDGFTGFASYDGTHWSLLGSNTLFLTNVLIGFAVTSQNTNLTTQAVFTDLADVTPADTTVPFVAAIEPPGPTSRRSALLVSEVMYHPADRADGRNGEFIEIYNSQPYFEDISGWRVTGDYDFTFPPNTLIRGGGFLLVAPNPEDITAIYGLTNVLGGFTNALSHGSGSVNLRSERGAVYYELDYRDKAPWPLAADGSGHSLALVRPSLGEADPRAWAASARPGGSPGAWEFADPDPRRNVVLNELLARGTPGGSVPFVELHNRGNAAVDLSGCRLGYNPATPAYRFPADSRIPAGGFLALTAAQLGFPLRVDAEPLFLRAPAAATDVGAVLDVVRFDPAAAGIARGRSADGSGEIYALRSPTPGAPNAAPREAEIVISEIMYAPLSGDNDLEYVELHNAGTTAVDLTGWQLDGGIEFTFPEVSLAPGGYLVVAANATKLRAAYGNLTGANCVGNFQGNLSNRGERLVLQRPEAVPASAGNPARTVSVPVDEVTYRTGGQWGYWADGGGSSLELTDGRANRRFAANWADSDESAKGRWTTIETTGVLDNGAETADALHVGLLGEGECLLDNLEVIGPGGTNLVVNGDFEGSTAGFTVLGNHIRSAFETGEGDASGRSLHIRASGNLDTGANRIRFRLTRNLTPGDTATLRARVRWLKGWTEPLLRVRGNWLEATGRMDISPALGTPGAPNSRAVANAGPALAGITHAPVLPAAGEPVVVSVRADDPDGIGPLTLNWRVDSVVDYTAVPMLDDGTSGDAIAGDGIFSATLPGQPTATVVAYSISASDAATTPATSVQPVGAPVHECLVRFGEPTAANAFGTYRLWLTKKNVSAWSGRPNLSNEPIEGTLVYGNFRAIHGAGYRYAGSPYHQQFSSPTGPCHYVWRLPGDDLLLGTDSFNKVHAPGNGPFDDDTTQREQTVYWIGRQLGLPWLYRRYVNVYINGAKRSKLMEDTQVGSGDFVESYHPDDPDGDLYKINPWFEFDSGTGQTIGFNNESWADLNNYTTTGGEKKRARYRWNWQPRAANGTVNDYGRLFALVDAANTPSPEGFIAAMEAQVDMEQWLRTFAVNHSVGNWDGFGNRNAQNTYAYKPKSGPWELIMWDANIVLGNSGSDGPSGDDLFQYNFSDGPMGRIYNTPKFRRAYLRFLRDIATGPMQPARVGQLLDAKYAAFLAAGVSATAPTSIKSWIRSRVTYLNSQVSPFNVAFSAAADGLTAGASAVNLITLSGRAPLGVRTIRINGQDSPVTWLNETDWTMAVVLNAASNPFKVEGLNPQGEPVLGASRQFTVRYTGTPQRAEDRLVFSEINYRPATRGAEFVELFNASPDSAFDLSGWQVSGLGYTFPAGSIFAAGRRFVLAADLGAFARAYDPFRALANDRFPGTLSPDGETLRLVKPGTTPETDEVITAVTYSPLAPWPAEAAGGGSSLQLINAARGEDERVGNWAAVPPRDPNAVTWKLASATGPVGASGTVQLYLSSSPPVTDLLDAVGTYWGTISFGGNPSPYGVRFRRDGTTLAAEFLFDRDNPDSFAPMTGVSQTNLDVRFAFDAQNGFVGKLSPDGSKITGSYINPGAPGTFSFSRINPGGEVRVDDITLVAGEVPGIGANLLANGDFESALTGPWATSGAHAESTIVTGHTHGGAGALLLRAATGGTGSDTNAVVQTVAGLTPGQLVTLSFWYLSSTNGDAVVARLGDGAVQAPAELDPPKDPHDEYTPGYANTAAASLPQFPPLWLNEVLPGPATGAPQAELFNPTTVALSLDGLFLSDSPTNLLRDLLPVGSVIGPGQFLVFTLDGTGQLTDANNLHTSFRPAASNGTLILTRVQGGRTNVVDFLRWNAPGNGRSVGHFPDASPHDDREFATPTLGGPNTLAVPAQPVVINEWMALNNRIADPAGGPTGTEFDDWFELFNPNAVPVNLAGFVLSNSLTNKTKFPIPAGYQIPARGYLLVWADNDSNQNTSTNADLHVNFKLSGNGEAIALFTPDGTLVDAVTFGPQQANVSEGRATDGAAGPFVRFPTPTLRAANAGVPPAAKPVLARPEFSPGGQFVLQWSTEVGRSYRVLTRDTLDDPWQQLGAPLLATGTGLSTTDPSPGTTGRFYQIVVMD